MSKVEFNIEQLTNSDNFKLKEIARKLVENSNNIKNDESHSDDYTESYNETHSESPYSDSSW